MALGQGAPRGGLQFPDITRRRPGPGIAPRGLMHALRLVLLVSLVGGGCVLGDGSGGAEIEGRYELVMTGTYSTPCPSFDAPGELAFTLMLDGDGEPTVGSDLPDVDSIGVIDHGPASLSLEVSRDWGAIDGIPVTANVRHDLMVDGAEVTGTAETSFSWHNEDAATTCRYEWNVEGVRTQ